MITLRYAHDCNGKIELSRTEGSANITIVQGDQMVHINAYSVADVVGQLMDLMPPHMKHIVTAKLMLKDKL
jgi:hypothetical protein